VRRILFPPFLRMKVFLLVLSNWINEEEVLEEQQKEEENEFPL
jgi:hypothetical protein